MTVFDAFQEVDMTYLTVSRGQVYGHRVLFERPIRGIFKDRDGATFGSQEDRVSTATVHVRPEDFTENERPNIVGNGIRYNGVEYAIIGLTEGRNFDNNEVEHLKLTLERQEYVRDDKESS